jgi:hypothetical protein
VTSFPISAWSRIAGGSSSKPRAYGWQPVLQAGEVESVVTAQNLSDIDRCAPG